MENILKELHWFCIESKGCSAGVNPDIREASKTLDKYETFFLKRLKGKNLKIFKKMVVASLDMSFHSAEDGFILGAKVGAKIIMELLVN